MKPVSDKRRAERLANGERFIGSSIAPKPVQPQPSSGYCPIRRKTKVKPKNAKRSKANHERAHGSPEHIVFVKSQPCVACKLEGYSDFAHVGNGGAGKKSAAANSVSLCGRRPDFVCGAINIVEGCHRESHRIGIKTFAAKYGIDLKAEAARIDALWQAHSQRGE